MRKYENPSGAWPRTAALAVVTGIILLASGCGGSSSGNPDTSSSPGTSNVAKEAAYSNCMSAHGVSVSVNSNGSLGSSGSGSSGSGTSAQRVQAAMNACRHLLPAGGQQAQAHQAQALKRDLKYTQCMRSHGVPNFPDPTPGPGGLIGFSGVNAGTPAYTKANQACQSLMPGGGS